MDIWLAGVLPSYFEDMMVELLCRPCDTRGDLCDRNMMWRFILDVPHLTPYLHSQAGGVTRCRHTP